MLKKFTCLLCAVVLMFSVVTESAHALTVINQDVSLEAPVNSAMETDAEAQAVAAQFTETGSSAKLSDDSKEGRFSLKVTLAEGAASDVTYTLAPSDAFPANSFSTITLWVKPGAGADWAEFYTSDGTNDVLLKSDSDGNGSFKVGEDLQSGQWTKLTLSLLDAASALTQGDDLIIKTKNNSVFLFDGVKSQNTEVESLDLTAYTGTTNTRINNNNLEFSLNASSTVFNTDPAVLTSTADTTIGNILEGKLEGIKIDSGFTDIAGDSVSGEFTTNYSSVGLNTNYKYGITDDGKTIYYLKSSSVGSVYKLDLDTGISTSLFSNKVKMAVSPSGNYLLYISQTESEGEIYKSIGSYCVATSTYKSLMAYSSNTVDVYSISDSGRAYYKYASRLYYQDFSSSSGTSLGSLNITLFALSNGAWASTYTTFLYVNSTTIAYTHSESITSVKVNLAGTGVYFTSSSGLYYYNRSTQTVKKLSSSSDTIYRVLGDGRLLFSGYIYDPTTGQKETLSVAYYTDLSGAVGVLGSTVYKNEDKFCNKYLLSFDGKNTWYSYKGGTWAKVCSNPTPTTDNFMDYGMTKSEVNALTANDFAPLYASGNEIYSLDAAIYFASGSTNQTPSIKSIRVITDKSSYYTAAGLTASPLYAAKSVSFAGSGWKSVNRIYPVEISPKAASFVYFFCADGEYQYYDGSQWVTETGTEIADLISDTDTNWIALKEIGMTARELRSVPKSVLTAQLAGEDFSVVYCMRVADKSTAGYCSRITADYTEDYFTSANLTMSVTLSDGAVKTMTGLTDTQVEDFMAWLKSSKRSSNFYTIKIGTTSTVFNYYMIQYVTVEEA